MPERVNTLRVVLPDQLNSSLTALEGASKRDVVLMIEAREELTHVRHHKQKIAFVLSAMRHFAKQLEEEGYRVDYVELDAPGNRGTLSGELRRAIGRHSPRALVMTEPSEWRTEKALESLRGNSAGAVEVREDERFLCSRAEFQSWASGRKTLRMEHFYRMMRRKTGWLLDGDGPEGGRWNYDFANRRALPKRISPPPQSAFEPDAVTRRVVEMVGERFANHFGDLEPFGWAVRRADAMKALDAFIATGLPKFGDYQDAMKAGEPFLYHSVLSPYLNLGLLSPREVCEAAIDAHEAGDAPLHCVEGFIRQIAGWREFMRGVYWLKMPGYPKSNHLRAKRPLPKFYWSGETNMNCLREAIESTRQYAYAHHIQRLMITGNFALLAGLTPAEVEEWYLIVYADAFDWVELPNTHGMALHADGGLLASKPYAASASYINRMSNYCESCDYDHRTRTGESACPFNFLYWDFLLRNEERLGKSPRMALVYRALRRLDVGELREIREAARRFLSSLGKEAPRRDAGSAGGGAPRGRRKRGEGTRAPPPPS